MVENGINRMLLIQIYYLTNCWINTKYTIKTNRNNVVVVVVTIYKLKINPNY